MLYTSGTTARPKGVLLPESALVAQAESLIEAWKYAPDDRLLHVLPVHHIHGVVNALLAPLIAGSTIELLNPYTPDSVWKRLAAAAQKTKAPPITFFTAVPTIWSSLIKYFDSPELHQEDRLAAEKALLGPAPTVGSAVDDYVTMRDARETARAGRSVKSDAHRLKRYVDPELAD